MIPAAIAAVIVGERLSGLKHLQQPIFIPEIKNKN
jgi:hypothetical protein